VFIILSRSQTNHPTRVRLLFVSATQFPVVPHGVCAISARQPRKSTLKIMKSIKLECDYLRSKHREKFDLILFT